MNFLQTRTWAEISLKNLEHNYRTIRAMLPPECLYLGVVKADAYGHGAVRVAHRLEKLGADYLAVACISEAAQLRDAGVSLPILILGYTPPELAEELLRYDLTQSVFDLEDGKALSAAAVEAGKSMKIHVKVDTGMSRLGFLAQGAADDIAALCALPGLDPEGIFTHFSDADSSEEFTMLQLERFMDLLDELKARGRTFQIRHCAATSAVLNYPCTYFDMVRPGIALYGHYPSEECVGLDGPGLRPVMTLKTRVTSVKTVPAGTAVSYGRTHKMDRESRLAVLPLGYADGFPRLLSDGTEVLLRGVRVPVVGRICMDMCMVDVTEVPDAAVGDEVVVFGAELPIEEKARRAGTISYELLSAVAPRIPRIYLEDETPSPAPGLPHKMVRGEPGCADGGLTLSRRFFSGKV